MNREYLYACVFKAYKTYGISTFPIDCFEIVRKHKFKVKKYSELSQTKKIACWRLSEDACLLDGTLFYNDSAYPRRIPFSIAHELGHHYLKTDDEDDADEFASHFLAPRILIHKYGYRNADQIHDAFGLSYAASNRALTSYKKWLDEISHSVPREPSLPELQLEQIFFPKKEKPTQTLPDDDDCEIEFDSVDKYLYILRVLKAGLPIPEEYRSTVDRYRRMGMRLK